MNKISDTSNIRELFPALNQKINGYNLVYLDNAATAHKPISVIDRINSMNSYVNSNIHRAVHTISGQATELYERSREIIRDYINANSTKEIIFTSGATASINLVAFSFCSKYLNKGDSIIVSAAEHHSNIVPWQLACNRVGAHLKVVPIFDNGEIDLKSLELMLDSTVKLVAISHISNVLGIVNPIKEIVNICHLKGVKILVDGAQGIVHSNVDVRSLDCDFYLFSGHKLYGPTGTGVLYGKEDLLNDMPPWMGGGDMVGTVSFEETTYADLPLKYEAGTPNFIGQSALAEAIEFVKGLDKEAIHVRELSIIEYMLDQLSKIEGLTIYGNTTNKIPLFSFSIEGTNPSDIAMILDKLGIAVRSGQMCCEPLMNRYGVNSMLRASFAVYNTIDEAEYFIKSLKRVINMLK